MKTSDNFDPSLVISRVWSGWGLAGNNVDLTVGLGVGNTYWAGIGAATCTSTENKYICGISMDTFMFILYFS